LRKGRCRERAIRQIPMSGRIDAARGVQSGSMTISSAE
jgi:hypothetical protein